MSKTYIAIRQGGHNHFTEETAKAAVSRIHYTDKSGTSHTGEHWTPEQVKSMTTLMKFPEGTTEWDKYVAFNSFYADECKILDDALILKSAHAFYFADEDAPADKLWRYMHAMKP